MPAASRHVERAIRAIATRSSGSAGSRALRLALPLLALAACSTQVNGSGSYGQVRYDGLPAVHGVRLDGKIGQMEVRVGVASAGSQSVVLSGDENIVHYYVKLAVTPDGILLANLDGVDSVTPTMPLRIDATVVAFDTVDVTANASVEVAGAAADTFHVAADERSTVKLAGSGGNILDATLEDGSRLDARSYPATGVQLDVSASDAVVTLATSVPVTGQASGTSELQVFGSVTGCSAIALTPPATCLPAP
ncbi:MAG TPA: hypothetical protein VLU43_16395 [Anaeromyxobacteraceae bacterium]|nr:hypothetical protein [Anaeromyxobacteraceae bacterium]